MNARAFTLIELLVVIAIIGILSAVALGALNTARNKGIDAAIQADIESARAQSDLYYDANGQSYATICSNDALDGTPGIQRMIAGAIAKGGVVYCNSDATTWVMSSTLKTSTTSAWCVDTTGTSTLRTNGNPTSGTHC